MAAKNSSESWGAVARIFHWTIFIVIAGLLVVGVLMTDMPDGPDKGELYGLHKSFGAVLLALVLLRLGWRLMNVRPDLPGHMKSWEATLAKANHLVLYVVIILMPVSGIVMSQAAGFPVSVFGLFELPTFVEKSKELGGLAHSIHYWTGWTIVALVALHIAGALKHHLVYKDNVLRRMISG
ncbi:MAG: cytochrome b [Alphaproteobacteria bacterium]